MAVMMVNSWECLTWKVLTISQNLDKDDRLNSPFTRPGRPTPKSYSDSWPVGWGVCPGGGQSHQEHIAPLRKHLLTDTAPVMGVED
jgi:hypothetical protein